MLAPDGSTAFADEVAAAWIDELGGNGRSAGGDAVAAQARTVRGAGDGYHGLHGRACAPGRGVGFSCVPRCSQDAPGAQVAVMIEPARPHELAPLVADAYRLTEREREVTRLVARAAHRRHRGAAAPVAVDGAGPPQGDLREGRRHHPRRARRARVLPAAGA